MTGNKNKKLIIAFMCPALAVMIFFFALPVAMTIFYSFTNLSLTGSKAANLEFTGLQNYIRLFKDTAVKGALVRTLIFTVSSVIGQNILGFTIAYLMQKKNSLFRKITGPVFLAAWVMPEVVSAVCVYSFFTDKGTLNAILAVIGIKKISWLYKMPMFAIIVGNIWRGTAYSMMVYQAALDNVSGDVKEAAQIDGAGKLQTILYVVVPLIKNTIMTYHTDDTRCIRIYLDHYRRRTWRCNADTSDPYVSKGIQELRAWIRNCNFYDSAACFGNFWSDLYKDERKGGLTYEQKKREKTFLHRAGHFCRTVYFAIMLGYPCISGLQCEYCSQDSESDNE